MGERLTLTNLGQYQKGQLAPCNACELDPGSCGNQYRASVPGKESDVMCKKAGALEIIDLSVGDNSVKISIPRRNGQSHTDSTLSRLAEAAL